MNPMGQIPYLQLSDGKGLAQSNAIVRFLAKGTELMPKDDYQKACVDQWMFWESNNHEYFIAGCYGHMTYMGQTKESRDPIRVSRGEQALDVMEERLGKENWLVGNGITAADIVLLAYTRLSPLGGFELESRPGICSWVKRCETKLKLV